MQIEIDEAERQLILSALALESIKKPGFDDALNRIALKMDNRVKSIDSVEGDRDRAELYDRFRKLYAKSQFPDDKTIEGLGRDQLVALLKRFR